MRRSPIAQLSSLSALSRINYFAAEIRLPTEVTADESDSLESSLKFVSKTRSMHRMRFGESEGDTSAFFLGGEGVDGAHGVR